MGRAHAHTEPDADLLRSRAGIRAVLVSLALLGATAAVQAVVYAFSGYLSPARSGVVQLGFALVFAPISIVSAIGVWRYRHRSPGHALVALVFLSFIVTTAIFWAHTSHVSYLHPLQFIFTAAMAASLTTPPASGDGAYRLPAS